jgi:signal recognition particle subunit SRP54
LGMGDIVSLVEKAQEQYDDEEAKRIQKKIAKNKFDFNDFIGQIQQIKKMGNFQDLMGMIPGMGKALKGVDIDDDAFNGIEAIIKSMTNHERENPHVINGSRRQRIATGSGSSVNDVNKLLKQFEDMRKMMRMMNDKSKMSQMMNAMKGAQGGPRR